MAPCSFLTYLTSKIQGAGVASKEVVSKEAGQGVFVGGKTNVDKDHASIPATKVCLSKRLNRSRK